MLKIGLKLPKWLSEFVNRKKKKDKKKTDNTMVKRKKDKQW